MLKGINQGGTVMISYSPFWKTLTRRHNLSDSTLHRLKHNKDISTKTLNDLCRILNCKVQDIVEYIPSEKDQKL